jgi:TnpA family transposase
LGFPENPKPILASLTKELDQTYRAVIARLPNNKAVRFEKIKGKSELILTPLDELEEPKSLTALKEAVDALIPRIDLPELILEISARTGFTDSFTHISERVTRASDLWVSVCAVLMAEACNTGIEAFVREDTPALKKDRLFWVIQNYFRNETLIPANSILVSAQSRIPIAQTWGGGDVASADGLRFVVPVRTVHGGFNPKYFGPQRGVTWYNLVSNQFSGLNAVTVPGTLKDSLSILAVVLEQQTELQPTQIMTDTGAYTDVVFGLFRLLGYRFSPRIADIGGTRFWRINSKADYGPFNGTGRHKINLDLISEHWDDMLRLAGSLKLGRVPATGIMRTLQVGERSTSLARAIAEFGRIDKTIHSLTYIDDETKRRDTLFQLNLVEGRHNLAREVFHGKRGELYQKYREGQEDQLGALGLVLNVIVLWNTMYINAAVDQLRKDGLLVRDEDVARLSPLGFKHINMLGHYSFSIPETVAKGELRKLRTPPIP